MGKPYVPFDWPNVGSPMTPFVSLQFRGSGYQHTFPNPTNKIYIQSATFDVLNDAGGSTASITLADPNFINLEAFFARAIVVANRNSKIHGYWFCRAYWGWTYYGAQVDFNDGGRGQAKQSGVHAYLLRDLRYDLDEIELKVTFELIDLGEGLFNSRGDEPDPEVGSLNIHDISPVGESAIGTSNGITSSENVEKEALAEIFGQKEGDDFYNEIKEGSNLSEGLEGSGFYDASSTTSDLGLEDVPESENIFINRTKWDILKTILKKWWAINNDNELLSVTWDTTIEGDSELGSQTEDNQKPVEKHVVSSKTGIKSACDTLLDTMELPGYRAVVIAGVKLFASSGEFTKTPGISFGWQAKPPTVPMDDALAETQYRLARTLVYRPGNKEQIAKGQTLIQNLSYEWTSKGFYMMGLPQIYAITILSDGSLKVFSSDTEFNAASAKERENIYFFSGEKAEAEATTYSLRTALNTLEQDKKIKGQSGAYEIEWNYESREGNEVETENNGRKLVINVWNKFSKELFDVTISMHGDPWLDNSIWNIYGQNDSRNQNFLVNLYNSYFKIIIHRPLGNNMNSVSQLITGNYLCLKGCSHSISEGEYSTSLKLIKAW